MEDADEYTQNKQQKNKKSIQQQQQQQHVQQSQQSVVQQNNIEGLKELSAEEKELLLKELKDLQNSWRNQQEQDEEVTISITALDRSRMQRMKQIQELLLPMDERIKLVERKKVEDEQRKIRQAQQLVEQRNREIQEEQNRIQQLEQKYGGTDHKQKYCDDAEIQEKVKQNQHQGSQYQPKQNVYDLAKNLSYQIRLQQDKIILKEVPQDFCAMISLEAKENLENLDQRSAIDLICVIDVSGSMNSQGKLELVKDTLRTLLEQLNESDRICLVEFESQARRLTPLLTLTEYNKNTLLQAIDSLRPQGGTDITSGMAVALQVLDARKFRNEVSSVFLLSDGQDRGAQATTKILMDKYAKNDDSFSIRCFGFGSDHDSQLMDSIAQLKDGSFYYIENLPQVQDAFVSALGSLMSVVAQNINIKISLLDPDVQIKKVYGEFWKKQSENVYQISLLQLISGVSKDFIMELLLPSDNRKYNDQDRVRSLIRLDLELNNNQGEKFVFNKTQNLVLYNSDWGEINEDQDGEVLANYFRVKAAEVMEEGMVFARIGQNDKAQGLVDTLVQNITQNRYVDQTKVQVVLTDLKGARTNLERERYQQHGEHTITNLRRAHMEQRGQMMNEENTQTYTNIRTQKMRMDRNQKLQEKQKRMQMEMEREGLLNISELNEDFAKSSIANDQQILQPNQPSQQQQPQQPSQQLHQIEQEEESSSSKQN